MTMRQRANGSLALLTLAFCIIIAVRYYGVDAWWLDALLFSVEAGMVGALADWFAVTALFRHPLGLKWIPHTALVPRKKQQLTEGVVKLVEDQLLDRELIRSKLDQISIVSTIIEHLGKSPAAHLNEIKIKKFIVKIVTSIVTVENTAKLERAVHKYLLKAPLSKWLGQGLLAALSHKWDDKLIDRLLDLLHERLSKPDILPHIKSILADATTEITETSFFKRLLFHAAEAINAVNLDDAAHIIYQDLLQFVKDMKDEHHPVRQLLADHLMKLSDNIKENDDMNAILTVWTTDLLNELKLQTWLPQWIQPFFTLINEHEGTSPVEFLTKQLKKAINGAWYWFIHNETAQLKVESYIKQFLTYLLQNEYKIIGEIVKVTLDNFSDERLISFIESKVEVDLQRIRLNGALIGAVIGALLYLILYGVYEPILKLF